MLFTHITFTALLLFVATVSGAPVREPAAGTRTHADHTPESQTAMSAHCLYACQMHLKPIHQALTQNSKKHIFENPTASLAHAASPIQVHAAPDGSLDSPADPPTQQYRRSPATTADAHHAHGRAAAAHAAAANANREAAAALFAVGTSRTFRGDYVGAEEVRARARVHAAKALKHASKETAHRDLQVVLQHRTQPMRGAAADTEVEKANKSARKADESASKANKSVRKANRLLP